MSTETHGLRRPRRGRQIVAGVLLFLLGSSVAVQVFERTVHPYRIPSSAMEPTLRCARPAPGCEGNANDRIMVLQLHPFWTPSRGDIVAFEAPEAARMKCGAGGTFTKRIIGLPGERVQVRLRRGAAYLYIDGKRLDEPYIQNDRRDIGPADTYRVPERQYFVMGDNRGQSCDSRVFGFVPRGNFVGPAVVRYWPLDRIGRP